MTDMFFIPKNVTTYHREQDGTINFYLSPHKMGVLGTLKHLDKKKWISEG